MIFRISAIFLVGVLILLASARYLSEHYVDEQRRLTAAGDVQGAMEASQLAIRLDPFDTEALVSQSYLLQQQGRYEQAADSLREATDRDPHNFFAYFLLGNLQAGRLDEVDAAVESYRDALRHNPNASAVSRLLAQALIRTGDLGAAKRVYEKLEEEKRISFQGLYNLGRIYVRTGEPSEGLQAIRQAKRRAETGLNEMEGPLRAQRQKLIESMELAIADALVVQGRYAAAREVIAGSSSEQAPALLQLLNSNPEAYREAAVSSEIY
jgi:tetratricopeptide (TPR) repeat protein